MAGGKRSRRDMAGNRSNEETNGHKGSGNADRRGSKRRTQADMRQVDTAAQNENKNRSKRKWEKSKEFVAPPFIPVGSKLKLTMPGDKENELHGRDDGDEQAEAAVARRLSFGGFEPYDWESGRLPEPDFDEFGPSIRACVHQIGKWCQLKPDEWRKTQWPYRPYRRLFVSDGFPAGDVPSPWDWYIDDKRRTDWHVNTPNTESMSSEAANKLQNLGPRNELCIGKDVQEQQRWGIDNHTRRCIEAVLRHVPELAFDSARRREQIDFGLLKAANEMEDQNWDMEKVLQHWQERAEAADDLVALHAGDALHAAMEELDDINFRIHPKGYGIVCTREGGLPANCFVSDYLGELYPPWRFQERQDAWKKLDPNGNLPDIYNITLDRPKSESRGFDVLFVEASNKAGFASRLSHSCEPNCHVICQSDGYKLTLAMYTKRHVREGEELCWDYALVTEEKRELCDATCLCSSEQCRGVFVLYGGDSRLNFFFNENHTFKVRNALLCRACNESITSEDRGRLARCGVGDCLLHDVSNQRVPEWLEKWISLVLEFVERENKALKHKIRQTNFSSVSQDRIEQLAEAEAKGLFDSRLFHLACCLDKVKYFLNNSGSSDDTSAIQKPLQELDEYEVANHLFNANESLAARLVQAASQCLAPDCTGAPTSPPKKQPGNTDIPKLDDLLSFYHSLSKVDSKSNAKENLLKLSRKLRSLGAEHKAAADFAFLYSQTERFFSWTEYQGFRSQAVDFTTFKDDRVRQSKRSKKAAEEACSKSYGKLFIWAQLSQWFKQTRSDVQSELNKAFRETLCLPDPDCAYLQRMKDYPEKLRPGLIRALCNDLQWPNEMVVNKNTTSHKNIFGSPMLDTALAYQECLASTTVAEGMQKLAADLEKEDPLIGNSSGAVQQPKREKQEEQEGGGGSLDASGGNGNNAGDNKTPANGQR